MKTIQELREAWMHLVEKYDLQNTFRAYQMYHSLDPNLPSWKSIKHQYHISSWKEFKEEQPLVTQHTQAAEERSKVSQSNQNRSSWLSFLPKVFSCAFMKNKIKSLFKKLFNSLS